MPSDSTELIDDKDTFLLRYLPGESPAVKQLRRDISILNRKESINLVNAVLITGETGVGKGRTARVLAAHRRWKGCSAVEQEELLEFNTLAACCDRLFEVQLTGVADTLIEAELFGWEKGAHDKAEEQRLGRLAGDWDDILLDEIGDASHALQAKILDPVQHRRFMPMGSNDYVETSARLIFATWRNLPKMIRSDPPGFRQDLYFRITPWTLRVPALRDQKENIAQIVEELLYEAERKVRGFKKTDKELPFGPKDIAQPKAADLEWAVNEHKWPGNVRELEHSLWQWRVWERTRSLREITEANSAEYALLQGDKPDFLQDAIDNRLDQILDGHVARADGPTQLAEQLADEVKASIAAYCSKRNITHRNLEQLFDPDKCTTDACRQALKKFSDLR